MTPVNKRVLEQRSFAVVIGCAILVSLALIWFVEPLGVNLETVQEIYKAILPVSAVILAFVPSLYFFMHSSPKIIRTVNHLKLKVFLDYRFKIFLNSSFTLLIATLVGIGVSYTGHYTSELNALDRSILLIISASLILSLFYLYMYGRTVLEIVAEIN